MQIFLKERFEKAKIASEKKPGSKKLLDSLKQLTEEYNVFNSVLALLVKLWEENEILRGALAEISDNEFEDLLWSTLENQTKKPPTDVN